MHPWLPNELLCISRIGLQQWSLETAAYSLRFCRLLGKDIPPYACPKIPSLSAFWYLELLSCGQNLPFYKEGPKIEVDMHVFGIAHNKLFLASVLLLVLFPLPGISSLCPHFLHADPLRVSSSISCPRGCCNWFLLIARNRLTQTSSNKGWWGMGATRIRVEAIRRMNSNITCLTICFYSLSLWQRLTRSWK